MGCGTLLKCSERFSGKGVGGTVGRDVAAEWMTFTVLLVEMGLQMISRSRERTGRGGAGNQTNTDVCKTIEMDLWYLHILCRSF